MKWMFCLRLFSALLVTVCGVRAQPSMQEEIELKVGEQRVLSAEQVRSYSEGTRGIVDVRLTKDGKSFVLVGQNPGETSLLFLLLDGEQQHLQVRVVSPHLEPNLEVIQVVQKENIRLDFYFIQLDRSSQHQVGVNYPPSWGGGRIGMSFDFLSQRVQSATAVVDEQSLLRFDFAQSTGWARLMRQASIITENGKKAHVSGGGEVNISVQGSLSTGIHRIPYGSQLSILPFYDNQSGRLVIDLEADVSDLAEDRGSGVPGRITSQLKTTVNLKVGQGIWVAGLSAETETKSRTGVPGLSQIPVLGYLFSSQRFQRHQMENVVLILPSVVNSPSWVQREHIQQMVHRLREYEGEEETLQRLRSVREK